MNEFILFWVFTNNMLSIADELFADEMSIRTPMFFWHKWTDKDMVLLLAGLMFIISFIISFFLVKWSVVLLVAIITYTIGRKIFRRTIFLNLVIYYFFSLIGFLATLIFTLIKIFNK